MTAESRLSQEFPPAIPNAYSEPIEEGLVSVGLLYDESFSTTPGPMLNSLPGHGRGCNGLSIQL